VEGYWGKIEERIKAFCNPEDVLIYDRATMANYRTCELCGKYPISWVNILKNTRTGEEIIMGNECIKNIEQFEIRGFIGKIKYKPRLEGVIDHLVKRYPTIIDQFQEEEQEQKLKRSEYFEEGDSEILNNIDWDSFDYELGD
jgi:hypothetical protein